MTGTTTTEAADGEEAADEDEYGCKVCRVLDERGMERYEDDLVRLWTTDGPGRLGYRRLADWLNVTVLRREMDKAGVSTLGDEAPSKYERLTGDDEVVAEEVHSALVSEGIDVDGLERDFVSYGVVRTHLVDCLGVERDAERAATDWEETAIDIARDHAREKVESAVRSLVNKGEVTAVGDVEVTVSVELEDTATHARVPIERALRRGYVSRSDGEGDA